MEFLDIVDGEGKPTGKTVERSRAHAEGVRHRTAHVWLLRHRAGETEVLLQKRSSRKDSFPGCYDISSAGHIPAGSGVMESALRELEEELGIAAEQENLIWLGLRKTFHETSFYGRPFVDNQVCFVYCMWMDAEPEQMKLQESEVESVKWFSLSDCLKMVRENTAPHCLYEDEVLMLFKAAAGF